jgi:hypothetical protein
VLHLLLPCLLFAAVFGLYATTAAPGTLFGDPSEYQFIPAILGIAHPPGYAFYTLLARLWQALVPAGSVAFRTNLLAAAAAAWTVTGVYLVIREIGSRCRPGAGRIVASLWGALCLAVSADFWQHATHANAHVVSAALGVTHLWLLARWWRTGRDRWLAAFALTLGWAAAHHPITLFGVPAYVLFVVVAKPAIFRRWRTLLVVAGCLLAGLAVLLYYPLRSPTAPFGPTDMRTAEGFWRHTTAQGLRVNLFHFGLADQPDRAAVFWSLLRLQFALPVVALAVVGVVWLARRASRLALLVLPFLATHLLFTLNTVQDVMAYLLVPFAGLAIVAGVGVLALAEVLARPDRHRAILLVVPRSSTIVQNVLLACCILALFVFPARQAGLNLSRGISLRDFRAAEEFVAGVHERFAGSGEGAVLVSDWEHLTPLWVHAYTQGQALAEQDVRLVYVTAANPWAESVWQNIEAGPIYLPDYRPPVRDAGFRLLPEGDLYRVAAPGVVVPQPSHHLDAWVDGRVHLVGYDLARTTVRGGEPLPLTLYQSAREPIEGIWMPYARLGPVEARWTTDSRVLTLQWPPGEVVAERYEVPVPFDLPPGEYPLALGYADLTGGRAELPFSGGGTTISLGSVTVLPAPAPPSAEVLAQAVANLDNQVALLGARARAGWQTRSAPWDEPLAVTAGRPFHLTLTWHVLASPREGFTVFVHLLDATGGYVAGHDYTPLGGAFPSYLWFPKWLPGQTVNDPYRLELTGHLPPGDYLLEVGMYGMTSLRRLSVVDLAGSLAGDRVILGPVRVE